MSIFDEAALELAGEDHVAAVDGEVGVVDARAIGHLDRGLQLHRVRVAEVEPLAGLGHDDGRLAVGREVHVVGVVDGDRLPRLAGVRIDRGERAVGVPSALFVTQRVLRSHDGTTCWGFRPTGKVSTTFMVDGSITETLFDARFGT